MINYRRLSDGLLLVVVGVALLLNSLGLLPWTIWLRLLRFWPLLLIAGGIGMIFRRYIPTSVVFAVALIAMLALSWFLPTQNNGWLIIDGRYVGERASFTSNKPIADPTKPMTATLDFRAGKLTVRGATESAYDATISHYGERPNISLSQSENGADLRISASQTVVSLPGWLRHGQAVPNEWNMALNGQAPLDLHVNTAASESILDLTQLNLTGLTIDSSAGSVVATLGDRAAEQKIDLDGSAGSIELKVGNAAKVTIDVGMSAGSVEITVPAGAGLRVNERLAASGSNVKDLGLIKSGDSWVTTNYADAAQKIDINFSGSAASLQIKR